MEVPEEEERASSDDGYTSSEGSLSADSESIGSAGSSMNAGAGAEVYGQTAAHSGPLGTFQRKLERTVTVLPKPQLIRWLSTVFPQDDATMRCALDILC